MRTIIVDDHQVFRTTLREFLSGLKLVEVIAEAKDGKEAIELTKALKPELVIMDIKMPEMDGFEVADKIYSLKGDTKVILYTMYEMDSKINRMKGFQGFFLLKDRLYEDLPKILKKIKENSSRGLK
ncbi:MAG: response regulator transcription factor [Syntrophorhabdaceae bacterium]|nr:response regulator transcription factor [Syntrophorhabdaceae bacterium]